MATTTTATACPKGAWTLIADGDTYAVAQVQGDGPVALAVATSAPAVDTDDWVMTPGRPMKFVTINMAAGDKLYGQAKGISEVGVVRAILEEAIP